MSLSPLLPIAASTAIPIARQMTQRLADGLSFAQTLAQRLAGGAADEQVGGRTSLVAASQGALASPPAPVIHAHRSAQQRLDEFLIEFRTMARLQDISAAQPIALKSDGRGNVVVANNHPERAAIEQLLRSNPKLAATFNRLAAAQTAAVQLETGKRPRGEFQLVVQQDAAEVRFE